jgi:hypothetical protein
MYNTVDYSEILDKLRAAIVDENWFLVEEVVDLLQKYEVQQQELFFEND